jgi:DNA repair protein RadA/Sms
MRLPALYVSGEESVQQLKLRADRLMINAPYISLLFETHVENILEQLKSNPAGVLVLDSIQTVQTGTSAAIPGSPTQMRRCTYLLRREAQDRNVVLIIVGQVNKQNRAAGPKLIEHALDVLLYLEADEQDPQRRILSTSKNRFGSTVPCCFMTMGERGFVFHRKGVA